MINPTPSVRPDLPTLAGLFYTYPQDIGEFHEVSPQDMPPTYRQLLAHEGHMTETVEAFYGCPVEVEVIAKHITTTHYARKILLRRTTDHNVVQFGIARLTFEYLSDEVREEIESEEIPLGRVLINHNVLREVQLFALWQLYPGPDLRKLFNLEKPEEVYGRTALIYCNGEPAVELLEIVAPVPEC
jgi:chorismate-pyruvate lyase